MSRRLLVIASLLAGCSFEQGDPIPIAELDADAYVAEVHPVVRYGCASLDCHGDLNRPLRLYSEDGLRWNASLRGEPLAAEEVEWNVAALAGFDPEAPSVDTNLVLLKPLAVDAGGVAHEGGDRWPNREDPSYVCMHGWLSNRAGDPDVMQACATAEAELDPTPDPPPT